MTKKSAAKPKATPREAKPTEPEPTATSGAQRTAPAPLVVGGLPRFNFNARPIANEEVPVTDTPVRPSYESIQQEARGPGVEKWRRIDKLRADLTNLYNSLREDTRYTEEHKAERAWSEHEKVSPQIQQLAPEAHQEMLKSAEGLERQSIPVPAGEGLRTQDTDKLLLTAHERSRLEGLIARAEKAAEKGPFKANPTTILKDAYAQALDEGGPLGGARVRAIDQLASDHGLDIHQIVDGFRRPHHREALENAQRKLMTAELISRSVPEPPFKRGGTSPGDMGTYGSSRKVFMPQESAQVAPKNKKPYWR